MNPFCTISSLIPSAQLSLGLPYFLLPGKFFIHQRKIVDIYPTRGMRNIGDTGGCVRLPGIRNCGTARTDLTRDSL